jgi:hemolysin III
MIGVGPRHDVEARPRWRGRLHQAALIVAVPAALYLVAATPGGSGRVATSIYAFGLVGLFGASAAYHRVSWSATALRWARSLDHSMIFVLIAGTYTPFALLALEPPWSTVVLAVVWGGAAFGIAVRLLSEQLGLLRHTLYLMLGWIGAMVLPFAVDRLTATGILLMVAGGLCYTVGAVMFWLHRPVLRPQVFGYHELWHVLVVLGSLCHYGLILQLVLSA